jgi:hypothetical protein
MYARTQETAPRSKTKKQEKLHKLTLQSHSPVPHRGPRLGSQEVSPTKCMQEPKKQLRDQRQSNKNNSTS